MCFTSSGCLNRQPGIGCTRSISMNTGSNFWRDRAGQHRLSARARDPHALLERVIEADKIYLVGDWRRDGAVVSGPASLG